MKTPYTEARLAFLASAELDGLSDPDTLGLSYDVRRTILQNRMLEAFEIGWNAALKVGEKAALGAIDAAFARSVYPTTDKL